MIAQEKIIDSEFYGDRQISVFVVNEDELLSLLVSKNSNSM